MGKVLAETVMYKSLFAILLAIPIVANAVTTDTLAKEICRLHPDAQIENYCSPAGPIPPDPQEPTEPPDPQEPTEPPGPTGWAWQEIPNSAMDQMFIPGVDDQVKGWGSIQGAWSGGVVIGDKLYVHGGGHGDGANNSVLAMDKLGQWERITLPSPIWMQEDCPSNPATGNSMCPSVNGPCKFKTCTTLPDGNPTAIHSYNLLATDGKDLYRSGGAIWSSGGGAQGPQNWKLDIATQEWSVAMPDSGKEKSHGNFQYHEGKFYLVGGSGFRVWDVAAQAWEVRKGAVYTGGKKVMKYANGQFCMFGDGTSRCTTPEKFGIEWWNTPTRHPITSNTYLGVAVWNGKFLLWNSGEQVVSYDPGTMQWEELNPSGTPGDRVTRGTFGRFSEIDGTLILVNGTSRNAYRLVPSDTAPPDPNDHPPVDPPEPNEPNEPPVDPPDPPNPSDPPLPIVEILDSPYYGEPQHDIVERLCGDNPDQWPTFEVRKPSDVKLATQWLKRQDNKGRILAYYPPADPNSEHYNPLSWETPPDPNGLYDGVAAQLPSMQLAGPKCAALVGVPGPNGQLPVTVKSGNTKSSDWPTRQGGIYIEDMAFDTYRWDRDNGGTTGGDCIGMPNNSQFVILKNVDVRSCMHHSLITSGAYSMYMSITDSKFNLGGTHNLYIDSAAYVYARNVTSENPGWGHALRCIAGTCDVKDFHVSNVSLDGSINYTRHPTKPPRRRIGMHPLEIYNCGTNHTAKDGKLSFYRTDDYRGSSMASNFRTRDAKWGCNLSYHDGKQWYVQQYGSPEWEANTIWQDRTLTMENIEVECLTDDRESTPNCHATTTWGSHPIAGDYYRSTMRSWLRNNTFLTEPDPADPNNVIDIPTEIAWENMLAAMPSYVWPYPLDWYQWTMGQVFPEDRKTMLKGSGPDKWPVRPHPTAPKNLAKLKMINITGANLYDPIMRAPKKSAHWCFGTMVNDVCDDIYMPHADVVIEP